MSKRLFFILLAAVVTACGGGDDAAPAASSANTQSGPGKKDMLVIETLPDPCTLFTEEDAKALLNVDTVRMDRMFNQPAVQRDCGYSAEAPGEIRSARLVLQMTSGPLAELPRPPASLLAPMVSTLMGADRPADVKKDGDRHTYIFDQGDTTSIRVLTGIRGKASFSGEYDSDLHLSFGVKDAAEPTEQRISSARQLLQQFLLQIQEVD